MRRALGRIGAVVATAVLSSCGFCTKLAGASGLEVVVERVPPTARTLAVESCGDDGCHRTIRRLGKGWDGRMFIAEQDLGRDLNVGESLRVSAVLRSSSGRLLRRTQDDVRLVASQPNGAACDGNRWATGVLELADG